MDKRTAQGKLFHALPIEEKQVYLLEKIYDELQEQSLRDAKITRILRFIAKIETHQMKLQNKQRVWTQDYMEEMFGELGRLG